jgi:Leu/Phe-tRNA-protein transferase
MSLVLKQVETEQQQKQNRNRDGTVAVEKENPCCHQMETCSLLYRKGECPKAQAKQSIAWYSNDRTVSTLCECLPKVTLETCSLPYHEGERPKARAKQSVAWYSNDKQCLLYPNVNQMIM